MSEEKQDVALYISGRTKSKVRELEVQLGGRVREFRRRKGLTLEVLAKKVGCTKGFLSRLEHDAVSPSFATLMKLLDALDVNLYALLDGQGYREGSVLRPTDRKHFFINNQRVRFELLTAGIAEKKMEPLWVFIEPGGSTGDALVSHRGEQWGIVLRGKVEISAGGYTHFLEEGDSIYFDTSLPHSWKNAGKEPVEAITVVTPPSL
jgi:transcriptional regulator with XRE-family HTH domain